MAIGLTAQRRLTTWFINQVPTTVSLQRYDKVKKPAGGWVREPAGVRDPQVVSLVEPTGLPTPSVTIDGVERKVDFIMVCEWDAEFEVGETFTHQGRSWAIVEEYYDNQYERRALVVARG